MKLTFTDFAWDDYEWWQDNDRRILRRINQLVKDIKRNGYEGMGKPEALRYGLVGYWSRRITQEHRIVYAIEDDAVVIISCRYHYE